MNINFPLGKLSHIAVIDDFLSQDFCSDLINFCKKNYYTLFIPGQMMGGINVDHKKSFDWPLIIQDPKINPEDTEFVEQADKYIFTNLTDALRSYCYSYNSFDTWKNTKDTGYRIQRYLKNEGFYKSHVDGAAWYTDGAEKRVLAGIIYLNTIEEGGGTFFDAHNYTVSAVSGRLALFPSSWTHPHGGQVPVSEDKWIISTFFC